MKFYNIEKLANKLEIESNGIDVEKMGKAFQLVEKKFNKKYLDDIMNYCFVFLNNKIDFSEEEKVDFVKNKNINFALVLEKQIFKLKDTSNEKITYEYYGVIHEGVLKTFADKSTAENEIKIKSLMSNDEVEKKALDWLENGRVGLSSATVCATLFPNLINHHRFKDMKDYDGNIEINWPHDNGDFHRCMKFFEAVPEAKDRLEDLKSLSKEWNNLVNNWKDIESLIKKEDLDASYSLIRKSLDKKLKIN